MQYVKFILALLSLPFVIMWTLCEYIWLILTGKSESQSKYDIAVISGYFQVPPERHAGYKALIKEANLLADEVIAIVNSDQQAILKYGRVIVPEQQRLEQMKQARGIDIALLSKDKDRSVNRTLNIIKNMDPSLSFVFANGGPEQDCLERETCKKLNIAVAFNVGGYEKLASSSEILGIK